MIKFLENSVLINNITIGFGDCFSDLKSQLHLYQSLPLIESYSLIVEPAISLSFNENRLFSIFLSLPPNKLGYKGAVFFNGQILKDRITVEKAEICIGCQFKEYLPHREITSEAINELGWKSYARLSRNPNFVGIVGVQAPIKKKA